MTSLNLAAAAPELILAATGLGLLTWGVLSAPKPAYALPAGERAAAAATEAGNALWALWVSVAALLIAAISAWHGVGGRAFGGMFIADDLARYGKASAFVLSAGALALSRGPLLRMQALSFEYSVIVVFAALGMGMMISANDLLALYVGLELQSLSLYVLAALRRDDSRATEAGLKYFVLGSLSSGLLLFGVSFIYGYTGATGFDAIRAVAVSGDAAHGVNLGVGLLIGLALVVCGLAFKLSAAPFHMWTPDVYQGAPLPITAFFATAPKVAAAAMVARLLYGAFGEAASQWRDMIAILAAASMLVGAFAAIAQTSLIRLLAYSSIGNMGFALVGLAAGSPAGASSALLYIVIYAITTLGVFAFALSMRRGDGADLKISDLAGLARTNTPAAAALAALMFSLAGIPPLAGFFAKLYAFRAAWDAGLAWLLIVAALGAVVSAFYYLRIVKIMFLDEPTATLEAPRISQNLILFLCALFALIFVIGGLGLPEAAERAAAALTIR